MQPRWQYDDTQPSVLPQDRGRSVSTPLCDHNIDLVHLSAEIEGTSWAVLSFAPDDTGWCDWLYNNLNGYPVPVALIEQPTPHGLPRPACLSIFPDRADPDYASHYSRALDTSGYLIVVCSARSAHSPAVDMQIRAFKRAGGEERIVALVVEGEPDAMMEMRPRNPDLEWLPAWLRFRANDQGFSAGERSEPRIVDARRGRVSLQGVRDALLAALLEIDRNALGRLGGLQRPLAQARQAGQDRQARKRSVIAAPSSIFVPPPPVAPPVNLPVMPPFPPRRSKAPLIVAAAAAVLAIGGVGGWVAARTNPPAKPTAPLAKVTVKRPVEPRLYALEVPKPQPPPAEPASETASSPTSTPRVHVPEPIADPAHPAAVSNLVPSMPDDATLLNETREWKTKADNALAKRDREGAIELYRSAIPAARLYLTRPAADATAKAEIAEIFRQLGTLQSIHASTAEARASYREGRRILLSIRGGRGQWTEECDRLYEEFETELRGLKKE